MKTRNPALFPALVTPLVLLPGIALASKNFLPVTPGEEVVLLLILLVFPFVVISNFILSLLNITKKKKGVRIYNCIASGLLGLLMIPLFASWSFAGLLVLLGFILQVVIIGLSFPKPAKKYEETGL